MCIYVYAGGLEIDFEKLLNILQPKQSTLKDDPNGSISTQSNGSILPQSNGSILPLSDKDETPQAGMYNRIFVYLCY
jgi:hypothetical protein